MGNNNRDNFTLATKNLLRDRVGNKCSNPHCNRPTSGPGSDPKKVINVGTAAHICAAAPGGPRYDASMTADERKSADNGIWLCNLCADLIDKDVKRYSVAILKQWKENAEKNAEYQMHGVREIYTANIEYVNCFCETLFLHKNDPYSKVNLKNLFVMPGYHDITDDPNSPTRYDLKEKIQDFINGRFPMMFISGSGGLGKTTLVAWMNYHYAVNDEIGQVLFGEKQLITVRLRDLDKNSISKHNSLIPAIVEYLQVMSLDELEQRYPNSVMVLDGFDELCMIESLSRPMDLIYDFFRKSIHSYKYIITSRPKYIEKNINIPNEYIVLQHFEIEKINEWIQRYTGIDFCGEIIDDRILDCLNSMDESSLATVCNTPMNLYMLVSKNTDSMLVNNIWALYRHIFYNEINETEYNAMFPRPNRNYEHDIILLRDVLYQISEEIAYRMYKSGNSKLYVNESELKSIINGLSSTMPILKKANTKEVAENCYALCCYWKEYVDRGAVEFLHNDIRDFFLAEKIYREMERLFKYRELDKEMKCSVSEELCELFKYGTLNTKVIEFLMFRSMNNKQNGVNDFASVEFERESFCDLITEMTMNCGVFAKTFQKEQKITPYEVISNVITCTIQVFRYVLEPYCPDNKHFISCGDFAGLKSWFGSAFHQVPVTASYDKAITLASKWNFASIDLEGLDLRGIGFCNSLLCNANLSNTVLAGCDFSECNLTGADFSDADAHYASFNRAKLDNCDFSGTDLRGTDLPDGFCSWDQQEQVEHLKSLDIYGLKINR